MALAVDMDECTTCGDCLPVCPTRSITLEGGVVSIDPASCTECEGYYEEPQCIGICPVDYCLYQRDE